MTPSPNAPEQKSLIKDMTLTNKEYAALHAQASNYRAILRYLKAAGLDEFLREHKRAAIDLQMTPDDTTGGESAMFFLKSIADECNRMDQKIQGLSQALVDSNIDLAKEKRKTRLYEKKTFWRNIIGFFFVLE